MAITTATVGMVMAMCIMAVGIVMAMGMAMTVGIVMAVGTVMTGWGGGGIVTALDILD